MITLEKEWRQWEDLPPEEEEKLIDKLARFFVKHRAGLLAQITLESGGPLTRMFAEFWMGLYGPYLDFLGIDKYLAILRKRKNIEKVIKRIEEMEREEENKGKVIRSIH